MDRLGFHIARGGRWASIAALLILAAFGYFGANAAGENAKGQLAGLLFTVTMAFTAGKVSEWRP